jgi:hypothetical protein
LEEALRALLIGYAPLTALVSTRMVWNHLPQDTTRPAVVMFKISGAAGYTTEGPDGLESSRVQIDVQALTVSSMWAIRDVIIAKLSGHKDSTFRGIFLLSERQSSEKPGTDLYHIVSMDFEVWASA